MAVTYFDKVASGGGGVGGVVLRPVLHVAAKVYELLVEIRNSRYNNKEGLVLEVEAPVISVGNVTTGGTGKTPVVMDIIARLQNMGLKPAVVSRGYKSGLAGVSDELSLIEKGMPGVICVLNPDRVSGAVKAIKDCGADVIVLDDGFQHRRLKRDLDIVLIDATRPFGFGFMLPRGHLREPVRNISRGDLFIVTRADQVEDKEIERIESQLETLDKGKPRIRAAHQPQGIMPLHSGSKVAPGEDQPALLVSGIGNRAAFKRTVDSLGISVCKEVFYKDHHDYTLEDAKRIGETAVKEGAFVLTTEKDAVKLEKLDYDWPVSVQVLMVRIGYLGDGGDILDEMLAKVIAKG